MNNYYKEGYVHIVFPLKQNSDSYPDFDNERVWAKKINDNEFQVGNIPLYVRGVSYGDIVEAQEVSKDVYQFTKVIRSSGHSTFRIFVDSNMPESQKILQEVITQLNNMGVKTEGAKDSSLTAIDIPKNVNVSMVGEYLNTKYKAGQLDYEEASVPEEYISPKK